MSMPFLMWSRALSRLPERAARKKLVAVSAWKGQIRDQRLIHYVSDYWAFLELCFILVRATVGPFHCRKDLFFFFRCHQSASRGHNRIKMREIDILFGPTPIRTRAIHCLCKLYSRSQLWCSVCVCVRGGGNLLFVLLSGDCATHQRAVPEFTTCINNQLLNNTLCMTVKMMSFN